MISPGAAQVMRRCEAGIIIVGRDPDDDSDQGQERAQLVREDGLQRDSRGVKVKRVKTFHRNQREKTVLEFQDTGLYAGRARKVYQIIEAS